MHMTRTDGSRGSGSYEKRDKWHMDMTRAEMVVGVVAVMTKEISGICT